ncbi:efflux RND transporter periplasmic adaptor subunit [Puia sp.]|uniref:efflux RND transporter periplasmic adaptor subunit n=1 Tax=Puia sp. TaxID=2045100 RepID=UPI002F3E4A83
MKENKTGWKIWIGGLLLVGLAAFGFIFMGLKKKEALVAETESRVMAANEGPVVKAVKAGANATDKGLVFIGEARPFQETTLYAKTGGYMNKILVDKGDRVQAGQLLATIVSPETDQAYNAAIADMQNKEKIWARDSNLVKKEYVSKEEAETSETTVRMARAQVQSLKEQMGYKNLVAPFAGTVTARFADPGALVQNAVNSQTSAQPVVTLSQLDRIRVYIYVPQIDAAFVQTGYPVTITSTDRPDWQMKAKVTRIAGELDPKTRMMLVEIDVANEKKDLIPGSYLQVDLQSPDQRQLAIPSEALVVRGGKYFVTLVDSLHKLHYQPVTVGKNDGAFVSILSGIQRGDLVALNVSPELKENQKVKLQ